MENQELLDNSKGINSFLINIYLHYPQLIMKYPEIFKNIQNISKEDANTFIKKYQKTEYNETEIKERDSLLSKSFWLLIKIIIYVIIAVLIFCVKKNNYLTDEEFKNIKEFDGKKLYEIRNNYQIIYNNSFFDKFQFEFYKNFLFCI